MKIFVTGANGFVGRHLCALLIDQQHDVVAAVRVAGTAPVGTTERVIGDIGPDTDWNDQLTDRDAVIHLAARVHVMRDTSAEPLAAFRRVNTAGTTALARAAVRQGVTRFVFLSSIKVNGENTHGTPFTALDDAKPADAYGISKHEAEIALREVAQRAGMSIVIVRTPLVYGPFVGGNFIRILDLARRGVPLPLASVRNRRTMSSIWNLVDLLEKSASDPGATGALILAGDDVSPSTAQLFRQLSDAMGKTGRLFPFPLSLLRIAARVLGRPEVVNRLSGSLEVQSGSSTTGWVWKPPFPFDESIRRTAAWYLRDVQ